MDFSLHEKCSLQEENIDLPTLREKISQLSKVEQIEIYKILKKTNDKITENKNGIFINLSSVSEDTLQDIQAFVNYSLENKIRLEKLEELSEELIRQSIQSENYSSKNPDSLQEETLRPTNSVSTINNQPRIKSNRMVAGINYNKETSGSDDEEDNEERQLAVTKNSKETENDASQIVCGQQIEIDELETLDTGVAIQMESVGEEPENEMETEQNTQRKKYGGISAKILKKCKEYCRANNYTSSSFIQFGLEEDGDESGENGTSIFDSLTDELQEDKSLK